VALCWDLGRWKVVNLGMLVVLALIDEDCIGLGLGLSLVWVLLPNAVVFGQVFL